jgi:uncharacterized membrane protein YeaQ/YmgE (transglycosylase-associated protein family)
MALFAELVLHPGGIVAWVAVGLIAGWAAGKVAGVGGYGVILDIALGLLGALLGGFLFGLVTQSETGVGGETGFWGSLAVAFLGACVLLAACRFLGVGRRA